MEEISKVAKLVAAHSVYFAALAIVLGISVVSEKIYMKNRLIMNILLYVYKLYTEYHESLFRGSQIPGTQNGRVKLSRITG